MSAMHGRPDDEDDFFSARNEDESGEYEDLDEGWDEDEDEDEEEEEDLDLADEELEDEEDWDEEYEDYDYENEDPVESSRKPRRDDWE